jgi:hypothetical protein
VDNIVRHVCVCVFLVDCIYAIEMTKHHDNIIVNDTSHHLTPQSGKQGSKRLPSSGKHCPRRSSDSFAVMAWNDV